jgi:hypothetical protein
MNSKYILAVFVAFVVSIATFVILLILALRSGPFPYPVLAVPVYFLTLALTGFNGVLFGTSCFAVEERKVASKRLFIAGVIFAALPSSLSLFTPLIPIALGGYMAVLVFKKDISSDIKNRRFTFALSGAICLTAFAVFSLIWLDRPLTKEKAKEIFEKAGGIEKVEHEANILFNEYFATNDYSCLYQSDRTNFPAISALGKSVLFDGKSKILIRHGSLQNPQFIYIFHPVPDTNQDPAFTELYTSNYIQIATNIFMAK